MTGKRKSIAATPMTGERAVVAGLMVLFAVLSASAMIFKMPSTDESRHFRYGDAMLSADATRTHDASMPFSALNAIPWRLVRSADLEEVIIDKAISVIKGKAICAWQVAREMMPIKLGGMVTLAFSLLLASYIYRWSRELYGTRGGILSLTLFVFSPDMLAHAPLVTTDMYAAGMATIALYYFRRFLNKATWRNAFISALTLGIAQLAKFTCIYLYPIFIAIVALRHFAPRDMGGVSAVKAIGRGPSERPLTSIALFISVSFLVINAGFLFDHSRTTLGEYRFNSDILKTVQSRATVLKALPLFLPHPFIKGLDMVRENEKMNLNFSNLYMLGRWHLKGEHFSGFKGYFFIVFLLKEPIAFQLILVWALSFYIRRRHAFDFWRAEIFFLAPILFFTIYFNFLFNAQTGIRYLFIFFPLLYIFCGSLLKGGGALQPWVPRAVAGLVVYLIVSTLSYAPHYLSYLNEFVWDRTKAYRYVNNSNLSWYQNDRYLIRYQAQHPGLIVNPEIPTDGKICVDVNLLTGAICSPEKYRWLRDHFEPRETVAHAYLVYEVSEEALKNIMESSGGGR